MAWISQRRSGSILPKVTTHTGGCRGPVLNCFFRLPFVVISARLVRVAEGGLTC